MTRRRYLIAIGSFAHPSIIDLQAEVIRATCGPATPILVSDDKTQTAYDERKGTNAAHGYALKDKLVRVCTAKNLIYRDTSHERIGHAGGDLGAFYHGLQYAKRHGIEYVCKLSQRLIIDVPGWLDEAIDLMEPGRFGTSYPNGFATASASCFYGAHSHFAMRTECVVMRVAEWGQPWVLEKLTPRALGYAAEALIDEITRSIGKGQAFISVPCLPEDRNAPPTDALVWKDGLPKEAVDAAYHRVAAKYNVTLGDDFNSDHSSVIHGARIG